MIKEILSNKKDFLDLLLLGDEQESMIDKYLEQGTLFVKFLNDKPIGVCVIFKINKNIIEIKNIAISEKFQKMGLGKEFIQFVKKSFSKNFKILLVGTGDTPSTTTFYKKCGFIESHKISNFFIDNYDHPIFEDGKQLTDMIYFKMNLE